MSISFFAHTYFDFFGWGWLASGVESWCAEN